jgi:hypothetical protein
MASAPPPTEAPTEAAVALTRKKLHDRLNHSTELFERNFKGLILAAHVDEPLPQNGDETSNDIVSAGEASQLQIDHNVNSIVRTCTPTCFGLAPALFLLPAMKPMTIYLSIPAHEFSSTQMYSYCLRRFTPAPLRLADLAASDHSHCGARNAYSGHGLGGHAAAGRRAQVAADNQRSREVRSAPSL